MQEIVNHGLNKFRIDTDGFFNQYSTEEVELGSEAELLELTNTFIGKSGNFEVDLGGFFNEYYSKSEEVDQVEFGREIFEWNKLWNFDFSYFCDNNHVAVVSKLK